MSITLRAIEKRVLHIYVGVHQESTLSPLLFGLVTDTLDTQRSATYTVLYVNDVFIAFHSKANLEQLVQNWNDGLM